MPKIAWITALDKTQDANASAHLQQTLTRYGLGTQGHFFEDNLPQVGWVRARDQLLRPEVGIWLVVGSAESFRKESVRYGLALLAVGVQCHRGHGFPIWLALSSGTLSPPDLPTPLRGAELVSATDPSLGPRLAAKANLPVPRVGSGYRLDIHGLPGFGEWFEVGPADGESWHGALFGVSPGAQIAAHGVGLAGKLPERSTLEYPLQGLEISLGDEKFVAWAVRNEMPATAGYFLSIKGYPRTVVFGPFPEGDSAEFFTVRLK